MLSDRRRNLLELTLRERQQQQGRAANFAGPGRTMFEHGLCHAGFVRSDNGHAGIMDGGKESVDFMDLAWNMDRCFMASANIDVLSCDALHLRVHRGHDRTALHGEDSRHLPEQLVSGCQVIDDEARHDAVEAVWLKGKKTG